jgi:hypothetical protein
MTALIAWFVAHKHEIVYGVGAFVTALNLVITFMLRLAPLTSWVAVAERSPRVAAFVRLMGALGIQPLPVIQALIDLIRGTASPGTLASAKTLQVSSAKPLIAPASAGTPPKAP